MNKKNTTPQRGRPAKSGRDSRQTKQALVQSGLEYFTEFGFASSGIDLILKKVSVLQAKKPLALLLLKNIAVILPRNWIYTCLMKKINR
jgi:hypothetical protein